MGLGLGYGLGARLLPESPCEACLRRGLEQNSFHKRHRFVKLPPVLIVSLNRWEGVDDEGNPMALLHPVGATEKIVGLHELLAPTFNENPLGRSCSERVGDPEAPCAPNPDPTLFK